MAQPLEDAGPALPAPDALPPRFPERLAALAREAPDAPALRDRHGTLTRAGLLAAVCGALERLDDLRPGDRLALLAEPGRDWLVGLLAAWWRGAIAVPLGWRHPPAERAHVLEDADCRLVWASPERAADAQRSVVTAPREPGSGPLPEPEPGEGALIIHTSGSTGKPKGVLHTHDSLAAQARSLGAAWGWTAGDRILNVLPLHHIHGIVNVYGCALWHGATVREAHGFDADAVGAALAAPEAPTLFMAVPTVYHRLLERYENAPDREAFARHAGRLRLMVSGSAALPVAVLERWRALTGQTLLERYGMSEVGMALSQPLHGARHPGTVGRPLPGMSARVVPTGEDPEAEPGAVTGELELRGETLFAGYWRQAPATEAAFRDGGWFRTGDVVARSPQGVYRILGRRSVDILKTGGYKVSALEIEEVLRTHPAVAEAAVVGLPDPAYGQVLAAAIVARSPVGAESLRAWTAERLASYKVPRRWRLLDELPRNALGKVLKPRLAEEFGAD